MSDEPIRRKVKWDDAAHAESMRKKRLLPENTIYAEWGDLGTRRDMLLLGAMFWSALDRLFQLNSKTGLELSVEIPNHVMRSMQVMMKNVPDSERKVIVKVLYSDAAICLKAMNTSNATATTLAVAHLIVKLTDEGLIPDPSSNLVLAALAVVGEASEDGVDGLWKYVETDVVMQSERLWERAQLAGYLQSMVPGVRVTPEKSD